MMNNTPYNNRKNSNQNLDNYNNSNEKLQRV